jgi:hypothetical protein
MGWRKMNKRLFGLIGVVLIVTGLLIGYGLNFIELGALFQGVGIGLIISTLIKLEDKIK